MAAKKKYYGVKRGKIAGVFDSWDECKTATDGYPGADFKSFPTLQEACAYAGVDYETALQQLESGNNAIAKVGQKITDRTDIPLEGTLLAYVDGSYDDSLKKYAFGCVFILPEGKIYTECGNGDNPQSLQHRNVTGEMLGAMYAVKVAMMNGYPQVELRYDYEGIEKWVTGAWRSKTELTQKYAQSMRSWMNDIKVIFTKVPAHSNVTYNELADQTAKKGLTQGNGVPKVKKLEEMEIYGTGKTE